MKKILEYRVFDLLKDKDNADFLDKVKKENPNMYTRFLNLVGNKGLEKAKEMYQEFDPEYVKIKKQQEKDRQLELKRLRTKEGKIEARNKILDKYSEEIEEFNNILKNSYLKSLEKKIKNNKILNDYLVSVNAKKSYSNLFNQALKKPEKLIRMFDYDIKIDSLSFPYKRYGWEYDTTKRRDLILIIQYYNIKTKKFKYLINFNFPLTWWDLDYVLPKFDVKKDEKFIDARNDAINKFSNSFKDREELDTILNKVTYLLSDEVYDKWKLQQDVNKYNL